MVVGGGVEFTGAPTYREKGPPHPLLRVLGPLVVVSSVALLGTGIALILVGPEGSDGLLVVHQTCFWVWVAMLAVHLVGHLWETVVTSWTEVRSSLHGRAARQRRWRYLAIALALVLGVGAAAALLPTAAPWTTRQDGPNSGTPGHPAITEGIPDSSQPPGAGRDPEAADEPRVLLTPILRQEVRAGCTSRRQASRHRAPAPWMQPI